MAGVVVESMPLGRPAGLAVVRSVEEARPAKWKRNSELETKFIKLDMYPLNWNKMGIEYVAMPAVKLKSKEQFEPGELGKSKLMS